MPRVVICYSHSDKKYLDELLIHLKTLKILGALDYWSDQEISTGERWRETIEGKFKAGQIALVLGSPAFFASDVITKVELPIVLDGARREGLQIIYLPVRYTNSHSLAEIKEYQSAQPLDSPLEDLSPRQRGRVYAKICEQIATTSPAEILSQWERLGSPSGGGVAEPALSAAQDCIEPSTIGALFEGRISLGESSKIVGHLIGTPSRRQCGACLERMTSRFLDVADRSDPEIAAAIAVRDGTLRPSADVLSEIIGGEVAGGGDNAVAPLIIASFALRFEPDTPGFLSYAVLAAEKSDAGDEPFARTMAHSWLARVRSIRGEFFLASREIQAARSVVSQLKGPRRKLAQAFLLHQSADRHWRLREFEKARPEYERSIRYYYDLKLASTARSVAFGLAISFMAAGQFDESREVLRGIFKGSSDKLLVISALQLLTGEVLPGLAREGRPQLAERALILRAVIGEDKSSEPSIRGRNYWSLGRLAWSLGAREIAVSFYQEASALFASMAPSAGLYENALIKLDAIEAMHGFLPVEDLSDLALQAAATFRALGADNPRLLALSLAQKFYSQSEAVVQFNQARAVLGLAERRRLLRAARQRAAPHSMPPNVLAWY